MIEMTNVQEVLKIKKLREDAIVPTYAKEGDSGLDLFTLDEKVIGANKTVVIPTGIAIELPRGQEAQVRPRSGISLKGCGGCTKEEYSMRGDVTISCSPYLRVMLGTVDNGYRSDVGIIVHNQEDYEVTVPAKTKLAQLIIMPVTYAKTEVVEELGDTERGVNGFGSTGV